MFNFLMAIHFHQPVDNFGFVVEKACDRCYEPFLDTIADFPDIKFNLHYSGSLLEWFKENRPGILDKIAALIETGQIELIGGGFYEPILPGLPERDSIEQIRMLSEFLRNEFGVGVSGGWLAERVWEPHLAEVFAKAGIDYTIVDDTHLRYAGLAQEKLYGYYVTEENRRLLKIFASDKSLRYTIPFRPHKETFDYFRRIKDKHKTGCVLYGDDGEKFGEWPGTNKNGYARKWLAHFLKLLRSNSSWLKTHKISDYIENHKPQGRIYIPAASYKEMGEWALSAEAGEKLEGVLAKLKKQHASDDRYADFVRGGFWRNFLVKYPESNHMHKKMLLVSRQLRQLQAKKQTTVVDRRLDDARRELFRAQCNCAYWHGLFGGLYLYHLRTAVYKHLIAAERIIDSVSHKGKKWVDITSSDFDCDGAKEFIVKTPRDIFVIDPSEGASVTEWSIKEKPLNILNTLSRKKEIYHKKLKAIVYDSHRRSLFLDHFLPDKVTLKDVSSNRYKEQGDLINASCLKSDVNSGTRPYIEIERRGFVGSASVRLLKRFIFFPQKDSLSVMYNIENLSSQSLSVNFSPELNLSLTKDDTEEELRPADSILLHDPIEGLKITVRFSKRPKKIFRFCVKTVSQSERKIERNYQASTVFPVFRLDLAAGKSKSVGIDLEVK
ncbi:MAG: DUF1926 domain-containing protein [Candidatus Omnitrophica bacterium]|nr:DUF1926 domain-containing protein [Candidatus Omnitrophota bacterium]